MNRNYLATAGRIRQELEEIQRVVTRTTDIWEEGEQSESNYHVDAVALNLHGFYAGLERLFEIIADRIDESMPEGSRWHQELLEQMTVEISETRPPVLSPQTRNALDQYRGFRHVVRNIYTYHFDHDQVERLIRRLPTVLEKVADELEAFANFLEETGRT